MTTAKASTNGADDKRTQALRREIARRHRQKHKPFSMAALRCAEISRLLVNRYGAILPDDDAGRDDARLMAHHLGRLSGDQRRRIVNWLDVYAPWFIGAERSKLLAEIDHKPRKWRADKLADRLRLTEAERHHLRITTIGAIDVTKAERTKRRKQAKREFIAAARRANGAIPRAEYEAKSLSQTKPWEALGMSRASWYRAGKPNP
jgi:hypothetical protein